MKAINCTVQLIVPYGTTQQVRTVDNNVYYKTINVSASVFVESVK